jgi:hypothetical protein
MLEYWGFQHSTTPPLRYLVGSLCPWTSGVRRPFIPDRLLTSSPTNRVFERIAISIELKRQEAYKVPRKEL